MSERFVMLTDCYVDECQILDWCLNKEIYVKPLWSNENGFHREDTKICIRGYLFEHDVDAMAFKLAWT
jgi:hypothetical protein